ncbi:glycosyltransferase family 2 protein [Mangrovimonas sp. AS39]|uniref:glycosyltransferase family 2 protein n=1 Tax=Mangrovimonas futianensis TaxID=2895523 RepID=UPI001E2F8F64|nr:glycosyltransferase family 2 protein [Mangrovimonas futianensis]MCF1191237.1 glycosyltransferase family 2 protein [Mangrovimonas futianensis]MCF1194932.1 glycosyltransferase family 2 protein [Mangrovimonas futianensis]
MLAKSKYRWHKLKRLVESQFLYGYHRCFNRVVQRQLKQVKRIPIIIISFNQLYYLKQLIDFLRAKGYENIVIVDNNSTYAPLLEYLKLIDGVVNIHRLQENKGHLAFWKSPELLNLYGKGYYVVTDPDVVPIEECPDDFLSTMLTLLNRAYDRTKVGMSLKLDDIPSTNPNKTSILQWERKYWLSKVHPKAYKAEVDTTFALYRPGYHYKLKDFTKGWRTDYPIQGRHGGWYLDFDNLTEEQVYYMQTANTSASWRIDETGNLVDKTHKPLYTHE